MVHTERYLSAAFDRSAFETARRLRVLRHLRHVLLSYMDYYNGARTHLSLNKDAPISRAAEAAGCIRCRAILGGLHHQYARA